MTLYIINSKKDVPERNILKTNEVTKACIFPFTLTIAGLSGIDTEKARLIRNDDCIRMLATRTKSG
jgi:hypothetical protein